jgi:hypothetical protein
MDSLSLTRDNSKEAVWKRLEAYGSTPADEREDVKDLPRWVKTALIFKAVDGMTWKDAAGRFGRSGRTLAMYARSPGARKWMASLEAFLEDPVAMAKAYLSANALSVTLERFVFLQAAVDAGDYKEGDKIARDIQDRMGLGVKKADGGAINVKIQFGGASLEGPVVEAEWESVEE